MTILLYFLLAISILMFALIIYSKLNPEFGATVDSSEKLKLQRSPNFKNGSFQNLIETKMEFKLSSLPSLIKEFSNQKQDRFPQQLLQFNDISKSIAQRGIDKFIWFGHSTLYLELDSISILIDPMFGDDASPIGPFTTKRFTANTLSQVDLLPNIDLIILTHDHYDHLDYKSILKLKSKSNRFFVPLGVGRHLIKWGIDPVLITEFDWWQTNNFDGLQLTFAPSRHFSGRSYNDRNKSLWGAWVLKSSKHNIFHSGDGGYGPHFKTIGEMYGPFDWGFVECGQYNYRWHDIHMYPEESVQAAVDAKVDIAVPIHWSGFSLALHPWKEPIERFAAHSSTMKKEYKSPGLGEIVLF